MSRGKVTQLGAAIVYFFENYLPAQRGMSQHTIHSYRDAVGVKLESDEVRHGKGPVGGATPWRLNPRIACKKPAIATAGVGGRWRLTAHQQSRSRASGRISRL